MASKPELDSPKTAARAVEKAFDRHLDGEDRATNVLIAQINQDPKAANAILKRLRRDDDARNDNVVAAIGLTSAERLLTGQGAYDPRISDFFTPQTLRSIEANPPGSSPGGKAVNKLGAHYLLKHYSQMAGRSYDAPANADGTDHHTPLLSIDIDITAGRLRKQPGWNEPQVVTPPTFMEKLYYTLNKYLG